MKCIVRYFLGVVLMGSFLGSVAENLDLEKGQTIYQNKCQACHGKEGNPLTSVFPKLSKQNPAYLHKTLLDYQTSKRVNPVMASQVQKLTPHDIDNLVAYVGSFPEPTGATAANFRSQGERLFRGGDRSKRIPACSSCHQPDGTGGLNIPRLAGQNADYVVDQLNKFSAGTRQDPSHGHGMETIAKRLTPEDKRAVASFVNGLRPDA